MKIFIVVTVSSFHYHSVFSNKEDAQDYIDERELFNCMILEETV